MGIRQTIADEFARFRLLEARIDSKDVEFIRSRLARSSAIGADNIWQAYYALEDLRVDLNSVSTSQQFQNYARQQYDDNQFNIGGYVQSLLAKVSEAQSVILTLLQCDANGAVKREYAFCRPRTSPTSHLEQISAAEYAPLVAKLGELQAIVRP